MKLSGRFITKFFISQEMLGKGIGFSATKVTGNNVVIVWDKFPKEYFTVEEFEDLISRKVVRKVKKQ